LTASTETSASSAARVRAARRAARARRTPGRALELDLADDHLPLGLDVADRLQQLGRHAELIGGVVEVGVDAAEILAGVDGRRVDRLGVLGVGHLVVFGDAEVRVGVVHAVEAAWREQGEGGQDGQGQ
jgi:hypothetical protein